MRPLCEAEGVEPHARHRLPAADRAASGVGLVGAAAMGGRPDVEGRAPIEALRGAGLLAGAP